MKKGDYIFDATSYEGIYGGIVEIKDDKVKVRWNDLNLFETYDKMFIEDLVKSGLYNIKNQPGE